MQIAGTYPRVSYSVEFTVLRNSQVMPMMLVPGCFLTTTYAFKCFFLFICQYIHLKKILFYIGVQLINNVVLVSGVQQSYSVIHMHVLGWPKSAFGF